MSFLLYSLRCLTCVAAAAAVLQDQDVLLSWSAIFKGNLPGDASFAVPADDTVTFNTDLIASAAP
jgi:hypothetical protein